MVGLLHLDIFIRGFENTRHRMENENAVCKHPSRCSRRETFFQNQTRTVGVAVV